MMRASTRLMYATLLAFFAVSIIFSFLCSMWEAVLLSITPAYAETKKQEGGDIGDALQDFKANIDRPLAAILTLNTIAHTVGAIGVGEQAAGIWSETHPAVTMFVVPTVMTLAILILSEIVPKTMGALHWQRLAPFTVRSLRGLLLVLAPFVWMSQWITKGLKHGDAAPVLTRTDFAAMAEIGAREGVIAAGESQIISNLLQFQSVQVRDVMTPRTVVAAVPESQTIAALCAETRFQRFSRLPIYGPKGIDEVLGYLLRTDALAAMIDGRGAEPVKNLRREMLVVPETQPIPDLLRLFMERREHIALVVDEFGGVAGISTMEDLIETLLGMEIVDETDATIDMRALAQRHQKRRAKALGLISEADARGPH